MFQRTKICSGLLLAFGSSLLTIAPGAFAQDTTVQRVEITGSSIKRVDAETSEPVTVIKADDLKKQGVTTVEQIMQNVSAMQVQQTSAQAVGAGTGGGSFADLRGLGANKTLVLLNGRRIASSAFDSSAPDINLIPFAAIERVEVLRDGASALYGTDAISGVINFITRKDYRGGTLTLGVDAPQHPGGSSHSANAGFGFGDYDKDGFNIFGFANFDHQAAITSNQRPYYQRQYTNNQTYAPSGTTFPATWLGATNVHPDGTDGATPFGGPSCLNSANLFHDASSQAPNQCGEVTSNFIQFVPETQKISGLMNASFKINENNKFNLEAFVAQSKVNAQTAPVPYGALYMHPTDKYFPGNGITPLPAGTTILPDQSGKPGQLNDDSLFIKYRTVPLGNREDDNTATQGRFMASLEGNVADWDYNVALTLNTNHVQDFLKTGYSDINVLATQDTDPASVTFGGYYLNPAINPFGANDAAGTALLNKAAASAVGVLQSGTGTVKVIDGHASRDLGDWLHAGRPAAVALGFEVRNEKFTQSANPSVAAANLASTGLDPATLNTGKRDIYAGFFELNVPIIKSLDVTVAARYDKYSDFGHTTNPKASFRFQPVKSFLLRGSFSTGFRAPSLYELNAANTFGNSTGGQNDPGNSTVSEGTDPVTGKPKLICTPNPGAPSSACNNQYEIQAGGNTALKAEKSKNATLGIVLEPFNDFTAEFDYYHISFTNQISTLSDTDLFGLVPGTSTGVDPQFAKYFHYNAAGQLSVDGTQCPGPNCGYVQETNQNLGGVKTDGIDMAFNYRFNAGKIGKFNAGLQTTYVHTFKYQNEPSGPFIQNVGTWSGAGPVFRWQHNAIIDWALDPFSLGLAVHYKSGYVDINPDYKVSAYTTMDLYGSYAMNKGITFTVGVRNLTDSKAPFTFQTQQFQTGYDPRFADPTGRVYYGRATYSF
jgi:iron complex outermembrane receptor protein